MTISNWKSVEVGESGFLIGNRQSDENNFMSVLEYDDIASLVAAQDTLLSSLDRMRHCLVELDEEGNVNEPVSGALIHDERN